MLLFSCCIKTLNLSKCSLSFKAKDNSNVLSLEDI